MLPTLPLGPLALPTAPLVYILGVWLALFAVDRAARRLGLDPETHYALAAAGLLGGFLGARLVFILLHWSSYDNLLGILWPLNSGYNTLGGLLIGAAAAFFYGRWRRLPLWPTLDVLAPGLLVFLIAVSLADFLGGPGYGSLTGVPWGVTQFGVRRHAVQLYEALVGLAALGAWWTATSDLTGFGKPVRSQDAGRPFLWAVIVYAGGRLLVDAYRENAPLMAGGLHVVQMVALGVLILGLIALARIPREQMDPSS
ncbi:prolipoprotein diacylglyceryl transferase [Promineifilum sp.]|uniref:prolipoprotein diacylglyceryl transferase n=1 Tax=Promineifilum sp. TaxID=2664178 RepID=UPI0035B0CF93